MTTNSPQSIAKALTMKCAIDLHEQNGISIGIGDCDNPVSHEDFNLIAKRILQSIPLVELLELRDYLSNVIECTYCERTYEKRNQCRSAPCDDCECCNCVDVRNAREKLAFLTTKLRKLKVIE